MSPQPTLPRLGFVAAPLVQRLGVFLLFTFLHVLAVAVPAAPWRVMPLGDSITSGYDDYPGYRKFLYDQLMADSFITSHSYSINMVGSRTSGLFTEDQMEGLGGHKIPTPSDVDWATYGQQIEFYKPDIVLLEIGTNDTNSTDAPAAAQHLSDYIDYITGVAPYAWVIVAQITPINNTHNSYVISYNSAVASMVATKISQGKHLELVDMYDALTTPATDIRSDDNVHPTLAGYQKIANAWQPKVIDVLQNHLPVGGSTYYVSNTGNDSNSGTSPSQAWQTVNKVNTATLAAGAVVNFEAGGIWREQLLPQSGTSTSKITYSSYGSGPKPLFLGSQKANALSWTETSPGNHKWATNTSSFPVEVGNINFNNPSYIENSSFTTDTAGWTLYANSLDSAVATLSRSTGTFDSAPAGCDIAVTNHGSSSSDVQFSYANLSVTAGKIYRLRFRAKSPYTFTMAEPAILKSTTPYTNYFSSTTPWNGSVAANWTTFEVDYTCNTTANDARLDFFIGDVPNGAHLYMDDITLTELADNPSIIVNPSFTSDLTGWTFWANTNASATSSRDTVNYDSVPAANAIAVTTKGAAVSDIQLHSNNLSVTSGKVYRLSFRAKASSAFTLTQPAILKQTPPYTNYYSATSGFVGNVTTTWSTFTADYTANTTASDAMLLFWLGNSIPNGATFYLDDVSFKEVFDTSSVDTTVQNSKMGFRKLHDTDLGTQGDFWYDAVNQKVLLYSTSAPSSAYTNIECAQSRVQCLLTGKSNIALEGLAFSNGAWDCIQLDGTSTGCSNILIDSCDIRFGGGGYTSTPGSTTRTGNAILLWNSVNNVTATNNYIENIYDAGVSNQGSSTNTQSNLYYRYNTILACQYSFKMSDGPSTSTLQQVYFEHNVCHDAGTSFSYAQRSDQAQASHILLLQTTAAASNISVQNNVCDTSSQCIINYDTVANLNNVASWVVDYNAYTQHVAGNVANWNGTIYSASAWTTYKSTSSKDSHSALTTY